MRWCRRALFLAIGLVSLVPVSSFATAPLQQTTETATQFYLRWRSTALKATSMDQITPFWTASTVDEFKMEPEDAKAGTLTMVKRMLGGQTGVKVVKETVTPSGATLSLEGVDSGNKAIVSTVDIVKEGGSWKITAAVERWTPKGSDIPPLFPMTQRTSDGRFTA